MLLAPSSSVLHRADLTVFILRLAWGRSAIGRLGVGELGDAGIDRTAGLLARGDRGPGRGDELLLDVLAVGRDLGDAVPAPPGHLGV